MNEAGATRCSERSAPSGNDGALTRWERWAGHAGYVAEGVFYLPLGFFALLAALGDQQPNGSRGALAKLGETLLGDAMLAVLAVGLAAFVLWQMVVAIADPEYRAERRSARRRVVRLEHLANGVFHCLFVGEAVWSLFGLSRAGDERQSQVTWTARAFAMPVGRYLVALVGAGIILFGLWQFYRGVTRDKSSRVDLSRTPFRLAINTLGIYGLLARGTLFCLVGGYLVNAAWRHDPRYSGGIAGALGGLKQQPYGEWLLAVMAVGLLCYGLYQIAKEPYRTLRKS
jgi:hypothetical protein